MKAENKDFATQVAHEMPMSENLRSRRALMLRAVRVEARGAPTRARMFGKNYVAFRAMGVAPIVDRWSRDLHKSRRLTSNAGPDVLSGEEGDDHMSATAVALLCRRRWEWK